MIQMLIGDTVSYKSNQMAVTLKICNLFEDTCNPNKVIGVVVWSGATELVASCSPLLTWL